MPSPREPSSGSPDAERAALDRASPGGTSPASAALDRACMALALAEAAAAAAEDEVPVGAVVLRPPVPGEPADPAGCLLPRERGLLLLGRGHNRTRGQADPTAHAELLAIREASGRLGRPRLEGCTVYSTVEPCFMCAGALVQARVARVVWGVRDPKFGGCVSLGAVLDVPGANHRVAWSEGVEADAARELMQTFFRALRGSS